MHPSIVLLCYEDFCILVFQICLCAFSVECLCVIWFLFVRVIVSFYCDYDYYTMMTPVPQYLTFLPVVSVILARTLLSIR